ncbi:MAG TPA: glutamate 5-kinase [Deltaproteobacteria bacterium]|nr:glutamate 5-kinase [Deltaproteobacteria bacterium]HOI07907.1 glutamate 5-kinase [Deltaproteobacteria bacterium]
MDKVSRNMLAGCRRVLIKIGSQALSTGTGLNNRMIERLCDELSLLRDQGREFALVSSGAIAQGRAIMKITDPSIALSRKQALAAIGQGSLIRAYTDAFRRYGYTAAQILITRDDLDDRHRYLNIRNTFTALFELGAIPIINENDTVSVEEIQFTDNDMLSAMIIPLVEPQALIILTDTEGVYLDDPRRNPDAQLLPEIRDIRTMEIKTSNGQAGALGRGGMTSKVKAAYHASMLGIPTVIASAYTQHVISRVLGGEEIGTLVHPRKRTSRLRQKDHWISFVTRPKGRVIVDKGAASVVLNNGKSLLPVGVVGVQGMFRAGDPIEIADESGEVIAVGLSNYTTDEIMKVKGANTSQVCAILDKECDEEVVHRNNMILRKETGQ